ncbi:alpha/beta fold hydrolase [Nocardioides jiangxiensis]|uniref:Alpha/beta hydrolase n=1 Tax=Nocardioides jiangxiensis TaxID=3064524 RepID=A0ABT9B219_9ACTN|nr:alpha/beta hydrolase [Nocardioides sp. WY-20]MDO7868884.1 alpha/beta hydrolase [Nocardioides sp. WY-20]
MTEPIAVSAELFAPVGPGQELCYQTFGTLADAPRGALLLVMGLSGPMIWWPVGFCEALVEAGFFVIRYDNRDTGRSFRGEGRVARGDLVKAFLGRPVEAPYSMSDLASDGIAVLDHLGIGSAHVCGMSMGGMIVQTMALEHPDRVRSVTSVMSTTGSRRVGFQHPSLLPRLLRSPGRGREAYAESTAAFWSFIGSPGYPTGLDEVRARALDTYDRGISGSGVMRQMMAVLTQPDRTRLLSSVTVPMTVIHGRADKMVHVSGGRATARAAGADLLVIDGMGHDLPRGLWPTFVRSITDTADRA